MAIHVVSFIKNKKVQYVFNYLLVPILLVWLGFNLYHQMVQQPDKAEAWKDIKNAFWGRKSIYLIIATLLMLANWGLEAAKWQVQLRSLQQISFKTAFKAVLAGTSFAANTPNRVGEYFGRMIYVAEGKRLQSVALTIAGSFSQLLVTLFAGCIGLFFYWRLSVQLDVVVINIFWLRIVFVGSILAAAVSAVFYFKLSWLTSIIFKIPWLKQFEFFILKLNELSTKHLVTILSISALRYLVFILQYVLVCKAFNVQVAIGTTVVLVAVLFWVLSIVPSFVIIDAGIRGTVSIELFKIFTSNHAAIFASSTYIWLINLMLPAFLGALLLIGKKVFNH
jgi:uncharacterized membrane protein YbhN (UPF0104 family)